MAVRRMGLWLPWVMLVAAMVQASVEQSCPEVCTCLLNTHPYITACNSKNLTSVPSDDIDVSTEELYLTGNQLWTLRQGALSKFENLKNLLLTYCEIETVESNAFSGLGKLNSLDLRWNKITQLQSYMFSGLLRLQNLNLDHNEITTIENFAFHGLNLSRLGLERNDMLKDMAGKAFKGSKVQVLRLQNSSLGSGAVRALSPLKSSLRELWWQNNQRALRLPQLAFEGFSFTVLNLNSNGLKDIEFLNQVVTDDLSLDNNPTGPIDFSRYPNLRQVRKLHLNNSTFSVVLASYFSGMTHLTYLGLAHNGITSLSERLRPIFMRLQQLSLEGNKLHCNCELRWLRSWLAGDLGVQINNGDPVECTTPSAGDITELDEDYLSCSSPSIVIMSPPMNVSENVEMTLTCVGEGDPAPTITWASPDGQVVTIPPPHNRTHTETQGMYHIRSTSTSQMGLYKCTAINLAGNATYEIDVEVYKVKAVVADNSAYSHVINKQAITVLLLLVTAARLLL